MISDDESACEERLGRRPEHRLRAEEQCFTPPGRVAKLIALAIRVRDRVVADERELSRCRAGTLFWSESRIAGSSKR